MTDERIDARHRREATRAQLTVLDHAYCWEKEAADRLWLIQPTGRGLKTLCWGEAVDEARRMAAHLESLALPEKSHIAIFSKNSAWWILSDLAIWMAGHLSIPLYPTLTAETIRLILEHSEAALIFIGKLDGFDEMAPGIPNDVARTRLPLSPETDDPKWSDIVASTGPLAGNPRRDPAEMGSIIYTSGSTGAPKGVMQSFGAMAVCAEGIVEMLDIDQEDRILSYLPMAHVFERWVVEHRRVDDRERDAHPKYEAEAPLREEALWPVRRRVVRRGTARCLGRPAMNGKEDDP